MGQSRSPGFRRAVLGCSAGLKTKCTGFAPVGSWGSMAIAHRTLLAQAARAKGRSAPVVRPAVEAVLAAAIALGAGQAGWAALTTPTADAAGPGDAPAADQIASTTALSLEASPFAPMAGPVDQVALAQLDLLQLTGVRMAADPSRSGAILRMSDGKQQAFLVGGEILSGIRLVAVSPHGIVVAHAAGERSLAMPVAQTTGLRQGLQALGAGPVSAAASGAGGALAASAPLAATAGPSPAFGPAEQAWLAATLRNPVAGPAGVRGFRLADNVPLAARAAGVAAGDVVEAINGAPAGNILAAIAAAQAGGPVALTVRRADGETAHLRFTLPYGAAAELAP